MLLLITGYVKSSYSMAVLNRMRVTLPDYKLAL